MKTLLINTRCAICNTEGNARELFPANFDNDSFNADVFSARRIPDLVHYRIVQCNQCGLVRSDPVIDQEILEKLYIKSSLTYKKDIPNLRQTYGGYLRKLEKVKKTKESLLEIGCGNGFVLDEALSQGYKKVLGVEPSQNAVEQARPFIRDRIINDIFRPGLISQKVDTICMFQLFDHIPNPSEILTICSDILEPGGLILCFNHNIKAVSARILGEKSPIIDIEHTYLYSPETLSRLFQNYGFNVLKASPALNYVSLLNVIRLFPLQIALKTRLLSFLERNPKIGQISASLPLGNLYLIAQKVSCP